MGCKSENSSCVTEIRETTSKLTFADYWGMVRMRIGINRDNYPVEPGLYKLGNPDKNSDVFISANYKYSFDVLRNSLSRMNAWILVLDTKGINVWCAAGKGTFGTDEMVNKINQSDLGKIVDHRRVIAPQLGAPGIAAHEVQERTGFRVIYGPVKASEIPAFIQNGYKATPEMRKVNFGFVDRLVLAPVELTGLITISLAVFGIIALTTWIFLGSATIGSVLSLSLTRIIPLLGAILAGSFFVPVFLPWIPGRAFAWKGWLIGVLWSAGYYLYLSGSGSWLFGLSVFLLLPALSSFLAMNFTGASTFTSLSGVVKEMRIAVPLQIISAVSGAGFLAADMIINGLSI